MMDARLRREKNLKIARFSRKVKQTAAQAARTPRSQTIVEYPTAPTACPVCGAIFEEPLVWMNEGHDPRCTAKGRHAHHTDQVCRACQHDREVEEGACL